MSTKSSIWYGSDEKGREVHIYWELGERTYWKLGETTHAAAPIYLEVEADGKEVAIRLPKQIAQQLRDILDPEDGWEVL